LLGSTAAIEQTPCPFSRAQAAVVGVSRLVAGVGEMNRNSLRQLATGEHHAAARRAETEARLGTRATRARRKPATLCVLSLRHAGLSRLLRIGRKQARRPLAGSPRLTRGASALLDWIRCWYRLQPLAQLRCAAWLLARRCGSDSGATASGVTRQPCGGAAHNPLSTSGGLRARECTGDRALVGVPAVDGDPGPRPGQSARPAVPSGRRLAPSGPRRNRDPFERAQSDSPRRCRAERASVGGTRLRRWDRRPRRQGQTRAQTGVGQHPAEARDPERDRVVDQHRGGGV
jgi:hypothetical protein